MPPARFRLRAMAAALFIALPLLVAASAGAAECDGRVVPSGAQALDVAGLRRSFVVRTASEGDPKTPAPVVFALHPFGMNAQYMQARAPIGRLWPSAIVVYPDGAARGADSRAPSWQTRPGEVADRDLAFFDAMVQWLQDRGCIDRSRVFVLGYSNGAALAYTLACQRRDNVAGVAIAAGRLGCPPPGSMPIVISHGLADSTIGYGQAVEAAAAWAAANTCATPPKTGILGCSTGTSCGAPVTVCTHRGGHEYDVSFTKTAVEAFQAAKRPQP